jgi:hypothetical protein
MVHSTGEPRRILFSGDGTYYLEGNKLFSQSLGLAKKEAHSQATAI